MQKEKFIKSVTSKLNEITGCEITIKPVTKNNGVKLTSLIILRKDRNTHPTIYLEPFYERYEKGEDFDNIIKMMLEFEENSKLNFDFDVSNFTDFEEVKDNIYYRIVNYEANLEMLESVPHTKFLDFAKVYYVLVKDENYGEGSILINNEHMKIWGVTENEIEKVATINTETKIQPTVKNIKEIIKKKLMWAFKELKEDGEIPEELNIPNLDNIGEYPMYVVSNEQGYFGASVMMYAGFLKVVSDVMKDDLIILPSSVHEIIFIKFEDAGYNFVGDLREMVENVNKEVVDREEFLSNNVYFFDRHRNKLMIYDGTQG